MQTRAHIHDNGEVAVGITSAAGGTLQRSPTHGAVHATKSENVVVWTSTPKSTRVELDPTSLSPAAHARIVTWLDAGPARQRIWLQFRNHAGTCQDEIVSSSREAIAAIERRVAAAVRSTKPYLRRIGDRNSMPPHATDMQMMLDIWRTRQATLDHSAKQALNVAASGRIIAVRQDAELGHILIGVGDGHYDYVLRWLSRNIGRSLQSSPDAAYGRATERMYAEASARRVPVYDELDCYVHWPNLGRLRHRYRRLMLPFILDAKPVLIVSTQLDETFDLRA